MVNMAYVTLEISRTVNSCLRDFASMIQQRPAKNPATIEANFSLLQSRRVKQRTNLYTLLVNAINSAHLTLSLLDFQLIKLFNNFMGFINSGSFETINLMAKLIRNDFVNPNATFS